MSGWNAVRYATVAGLRCAVVDDLSAWFADSAADHDPAVSDYEAGKHDALIALSVAVHEHEGLALAAPTPTDPENDR